MSLETGKIYDGKVRNIAAYGAFVEITADEKVHVGMVHISEVSNTFVNEIREHLTEGQEVRVKVLNIDENGKMSLSIKKAADTPAPRPRPQGQKPDRFGGQRNFENRENRNGFPRNSGNRNSGGGQPAEFIPNRQAAKPQTADSSFEDMLSRFKQSSDEKMSDLKKNMDGKRRNTKRGR